MLRELCLVSSLAVAVVYHVLTMDDVAEDVEEVFEKYLQTPEMEADSIPEISFAGGVFLMRARDRVATHSGGYAMRYSDRAGHNLHPKRWVPMSEDKIFDLASITKIWVSACFFILQKEQNVSVETPVFKLLPGFLGENYFKGFDKRKVLIRHLMTHTSGFTPEPTPMLDTLDVPVEKLRLSVIHNSLVNEPGTVGTYSDVNYMILGFIIEKISGMTLDQFLKVKLVGPMGLKDTGYNPDPDLTDRIVANEFIAPGHELGRPQPIRGVVHDDKAYLLNGVAGHAGIFSTVHDMQQFCEMLLSRGCYKGKQIIDPGILDMALQNHTAHIPEWNRGLGFELNSSRTMGSFVDLPGGAYGHTGFTGTNFVINEVTQSYMVFFTNATHPRRELGDINPARRELAQVVVDYIDQL